MIDELRIATENNPLLAFIEILYHKGYKISMNNIQKRKAIRK
jgi:hypothetical protein